MIVQAISLLVAQATEVAKFMTNLTLVLVCWRPKPFSVLGAPHFRHLSGHVHSQSNLLLFSGGILGLYSSNLLAPCLNLKVLFIWLDLLGVISVC